ncbi:hypothetical protein SESBI_07379 [Sesbania bispinosa]|nr:hypothetical protein SESBI_07379 [Sesbania bispinosa]
MGVSSKAKPMDFPSNLLASTSNSAKEILRHLPILPLNLKTDLVQSGFIGESSTPYVCTPHSIWHPKSKQPPM